MAPVYSLLDQVLLQIPETCVPVHLRPRLPFLRTRRRVHELLRFPTRQLPPGLSVPETSGADVFCLELPNHIRMLWFIALHRPDFNWVIFECRHLHEHPRTRHLAEYTYRVKWNETFEGNNIWTYTIRP
jgi:hypothetical protein